MRNLTTIPYICQAKAKLLMEAFAPLKYSSYPLVWMRALRFVRTRFKRDKSITIHGTNIQTTSDKNFQFRNLPVI